jgi:hypothetical protein
MITAKVQAMMAYELKLKRYSTQQQHARLTGKLQHTIISNLTQKRNRLACKTVDKIVKVHCNLRLVDKIEDICYADEYIDWSSDDE